MPLGNESGGGVSEIYGFLGAIGTVAAVVAANFYRTWTKEAETDAGQPRQVILERAELADLGETTRLMREIAPKLQSIYDIDDANRRNLDGNRELMSEALRILRRLEAEIDVAKRLREERLLERGRRESNGG